VANLQNLKKFDVFSEHVTDYSPLAKTKVEDFQIWKMRVPVDLKSLAGATSLNKLSLWNLNEISGFESLGALVNLKELTLLGVIPKEGTADLSFAKSLANLEKLTLNDSKISNFDAVGACTKLTSVQIDKKTTGVTSLAALKKLPNLKNVSIPKGVFPDAELAGFGEKVKITQH
jgi:Leucine-rich repeat (LRR) protein